MGCCSFVFSLLAHLVVGIYTYHVRVAQGRVERGVWQAPGPDLEHGGAARERLELAVKEAALSPARLGLVPGRDFSRCKACPHTRAREHDHAHMPSPSRGSGAAVRRPRQQRLQQGGRAP